MNARILLLLSCRTFRTPPVIDCSNYLRVFPHPTPSASLHFLSPPPFNTTAPETLLIRPHNFQRRNQGRSLCTWLTLQTPPTFNHHLHTPSILPRLSAPTSSSRAPPEGLTAIAHGEHTTNHSPSRLRPLPRTSCSMHLVTFHSSTSILTL